MSVDERQIALDNCHFLARRLLDRRDYERAQSMCRALALHQQHIITDSALFTHFDWMEELLKEEERAHQ